LNQLQLSRDDEDDIAAASKKKNPSVSTDKATPSLPASLINTYFHLFETTIQQDKAKKKGSKGNNKNSSTDTSGMKSRLLSALLTGVNRAHPYLPRKDKAMEQHIDALYRISHTAPPSAATQALMLLFQLAVGSGEEAAAVVEDKGGNKRAQKKEEDSATLRKDRFYRALYSKISVPEMLKGRQLTLFFNLLYKAMKYDTNTERICAFLKRLLHTVLHQSSSIICGTLFLLSEIIKCHPEVLVVDASNADGLGSFDASKREPCAAFDGKAIDLSENLWELCLLIHHFHPSVSKFTSQSQGNISYAGDPLKDFALAPFLDKFAFRNPKALKDKRDGMVAAGRKTGLQKIIRLPMNDPSLLDADVPAEERFFQQFFAERAKRDEIKGVVRVSGDKDRGDGEDEALDAAEKVADEVSLLFNIPNVFYLLFQLTKFIICSIRTLTGAMKIPKRQHLQISLQKG
jgi:ribosome biogenesis protein MAK21